MNKKEALGTLFIVFYYNITGSFVTISLVYIFSILKLSISISNGVLFFSTICFYVQLCTTMLMLMTCGYHQLFALNKFLKKSVDSEDLHNISEIIRNTSILYCKICDTFDAISKFFFVINIIFISGFFYYNIFQYFAFFIYFKNPNERLRYFIWSASLWIFYFSPTFGSSMRLSTWVQKEACITNTLIQRLATCKANRKAMKMSVILSLMVAHRKPRVTVGLFELNFKTFFSIFTSIVSFSIILIQFYDVGKH